MFNEYHALSFPKPVKARQEGWANGGGYGRPCNSLHWYVLVLFTTYDLQYSTCNLPCSGAATQVIRFYLTETFYVH